METTKPTTTSIDAKLPKIILPINIISSCWPILHRVRFNKTLHVAALQHKCQDTCSSPQFSRHCVMWAIFVRVDTRRRIYSDGLRVAKGTGYAVAANPAIAALKRLTHRVHGPVATPGVVEVKVAG